MFAEERQEKLLGILREKRKVAVSEMCDVFNVSGATIRADLRQLEEEGLLTRTHGGAVLRTRASFEQASDAREIVNLSAKERIGQRAAALVEDGDIIVLDTGTTTLHIARNIRDRQNVTVVTNGKPAALGFSTPFNFSWRFCLWSRWHSPFECGKRSWHLFDNHVCG